MAKSQPDKNNRPEQPIRNEPNQADQGPPEPELNTQSAGGKPQDSAQNSEVVNNRPLGITTPTPAPQAATSSAEQSLPRFARQNAVVICPYHHVPCKAGRTEAFFTRFYCPEEGCTFSHKEPRPKMENRIRAAEAAEGDYSARPRG